MIENTPDTKQSGNLTPVTSDLAKAKIRLALTNSEVNLQAIQNKADSMVLNEDNLDEINKTITAIKSAQKKIEDAFTEGKKPYWEAGKAWDAAKSDLTGLLAPILIKLDREHTKLCQAVEAKNRANKAKEEKEKAIKEAINTKILDWSTQITAAQTDAQIVAIEKAMGTEKSWGKGKYGDFLPELITRIDELKPLITTQKEAMRTLTGLNKEEEKAIELGDDQKLIDITDKKEEVVAKVQEARVRVEEKAINSSVSSWGSRYTQEFPTVRPSRKTWKTELVDPAAAVKGDISLLRIELNPETVKAKLKQLQDEGKLKEGETEELIVAGIKFYLDKKF